MQKQIVQKLHKNFEDYRCKQDNVEYWFARDLQKLLEYGKWDNFKKVIEKAKSSCKNSKQQVSDHFADVGKTIKMPKGAEKEIDDIMLTRYACYLITQNGDPRKEVIAFAQTYFAIQTRRQNVLIERMKLEERVRARKKLSETETQLSKNIFERGVDHRGFGRIRSKGDSALFGGINTTRMKKKLGVKSGPLANKLPTITIKAKDFATELTNFNVEKEDLPPEEDTKKLERKLKSKTKELDKISKLSIGKNHHE